jgi:hypothetical protein
MYIFRKEDSKLARLQLKESVGCVMKELHIFFFLELSIGLMSVATRPPADRFGTADAELDIDVPVMTFELGRGSLCGLARGRADDGLQSVGDVRLAVRLVLQICDGNPCKGIGQQGVQGCVSGGVGHRVYDHGSLIFGYALSLVIK